MILTVDNGQSVTKIACVDDHYDLEGIVQEPISPDDIQARIIAESRQSGLSELAIATTWFTSNNKRQALGKLESRRKVIIDLDEIERETGVRKIQLYNDAEATALALNTPFDGITIQTGDISQPAIKTLVYVGTGFQMVRTHYDSQRNAYLPHYGGGLRAALPMSLLDIVDRSFLERVAECAMVERISQLRHTHILGANGLQNVHRALTGENKKTREIIDGASSAGVTFDIYSGLLGRCLQNFASNSGFSQAVYFGGTFAPVIAPHLNLDTVREAFAVSDNITIGAYNTIPLKIMNEAFAANKGAAFGLRNRIETTSCDPL